MSDKSARPVESEDMAMTGLATVEDSRVDAIAAIDTGQEKGKKDINM
jgi:hypothetical protein